MTLKGDGFRTLVAAGDSVDVGDPLLQFDLAKIRAAGLSPITPIIVLNNDQASIELT